MSISQHLGAAFSDENSSNSKRSESTFEQSVGLIIDGFGEIPYSLISSELLPFLLFPVGTNNIDSIAFGNGTGIGSETSQDAKMIAFDYMKKKVEYLLKSEKLQEYSPDIMATPIGQFYLEEILKGANDTLYRFFEQDAATTLLTNGYIPNQKERQKFRLHGFGYSNFDNNMRSVESLVNPWKIHLCSRRFIQPTAVALPAGVSLLSSPSLKTVQTLGRNLIRKSSIAQSFFIDGSRGTWVYSIPEDKMVKVTVDMFQSVLIRDYNVFLEEEKNPNKRPPQQLNHVTQFYRSNIGLKHPFKVSMTDNNITADEITTLIPTVLKEVQKYPMRALALTTERFTEAKELFSKIMTGTKNLDKITGADKTELLKLTPDGHFVDISEYLDTNVGLEVLRVPYYETVLYFIQNPARVPALLNNTNFVHVKETIDELVNLAISIGAIGMIELMNIIITSKHPVQDSIIQNNFLDITDLQMVFYQNAAAVAERTKPNSAITQPSTAAFVDEFLKLTTVSGKTLDSIRQSRNPTATVAITNDILINMDTIFPGLGSEIATAFSNNSLPKLSADSTFTSSPINHSLMPFIYNTTTDPTGPEFKFQKYYGFDVNPAPAPTAGKVAADAEIILQSLRFEPYSKVIEVIIVSLNETYLKQADYNILVLQPNIEFEMASGILMKTGVMTAYFAHTGPPRKYPYTTGTVSGIKLVTDGKTVVTDPRGLITMEDIKFSKYLAGGGLNPALSVSDLMESERNGHDVLLIPVPKTYLPTDEYIDLNLGMTGTVRHYQGFQIDYSAETGKFTKITESKGHLRGAATLPGALKVMNGFKQMFDEVDYSNIVKQVN